MFSSIGLETIIYYVFLVLVLLISIGLHEYAHAWTSYKLGDPTPVLQGRLTPNPLKHIDLIGLACVFLIGFGWGKPVQINPIYYKKPLRDETLTALAGPAMNIVLALIGMVIVLIYARIFGIGVQDVFLGNGDFVVLFWQMFIIMNIGLAVFNMIPLPPLDGFRLVKVFRKKGAQWMEKNMGIISLIFIVLIVSGSPIISTYMSVVVDAIYRLLFMIFGSIFY